MLLTSTVLDYEKSKITNNKSMNKPTKVKPKTKHGKPKQNWIYTDLTKD